jgi:hypothetical protein
MSVLIAEVRLFVSDALLGRLAQKHQAIRWRELNEDLKHAYARKAAFLDSELRTELGVGAMSEQHAFYNAYYWALLFAKRYQARYGFDAGIEQLTFRVLECAPADVDWAVVERISLDAHQA